MSSLCSCGIEKRSAPVLNGLCPIMLQGSNCLRIVGMLERESSVSLSFDGRVRITCLIYIRAVFFCCVVTIG